MSNVRVMFIGQGPSGFAEDRVVNTFHFHGSLAWDAGDSVACLAAVNDFYNGYTDGVSTQSRSLGVDIALGGPYRRAPGVQP